MDCEHTHTAELVCEPVRTCGCVRRCRLVGVKEVAPTNLQRNKMQKFSELTQMALLYDLNTFLLSPNLHSPFYHGAETMQKVAAADVDVFAVLQRQATNK